MFRDWCGRSVLYAAARSSPSWSVNRPGQTLGDAVLPADPLDQHLGRAGLDEPSGKHGPVIRHNLVGDAVQEGAGGHIELPQLHRARVFPPFVVLPPALPGLRLSGRCGPVPGRPWSGDGAVAAAVHLKHQPLRTPLRVSPAQLADRRLHIGRDLPRMGMTLWLRSAKPDGPSSR